MRSPRTVAILGATGSIGRSARDVIVSAREAFDVRVVTAQSRAADLAAMARELGARVAVIGDEAGYAELQGLLAGTGIEARAGSAALADSVPEGTDICLSAITGMAGLLPLLTAVRRCSAVAIANKEPLVAAGALVLAEARKAGCRILPVDSEHNAVFQLFDFERPEGVERIILTASGGPFRTWSAEQMAGASPEQALAHPTWSMGRKISVDSATMMNKALEVVEAGVLFGLPPEKIEVLIHPQSLVHGMVEYVDGSILAQMGASDMRTPIAHVLGWPERIGTPGRRLDLAVLSRLDFEPPDQGRFPALGLAYACLREGGAAALVMNAANEEAVEAFLQRRLDFLGIVRAVEYALSHRPEVDTGSLGALLEADGLVRRRAREYIDRMPAQPAAKAKAGSS
jgi:1-deoxy-D-xylulose-5-phosphate reductoisomerase